MCVFRCPGVGYGAQHIEGSIHGFIEVAVTVVNLMSEYTTQTEREVETFVRSGEIEVSFEFRDTCSAVFFVIFIKNTIVIQIFKTYISGLGVGLYAYPFFFAVDDDNSSVFGIPSFSFRIALENPICTI